MKTSKLSLMVFTVIGCFSNGVLSQDQPSRGPQGQKGWSVSIGGGLLINPTYVGDDNYQVSALPNLRIAYGDTFFASVQEGVGYSVINKNGWKIGPLLKFDFGRDEGGNSPFRIAGTETTDLNGFGKIDFTFEAGGFVSYTANHFNSKLELRRGINGHESFVGEFTISRTGRNTLFGRTGIFSVGPSVKYAGRRYNQAFFGVNIIQAVASGLPQYSAGSGLVSFGLSGSQVILLSDNISAVAFGGFDRLGSVAQNSSLIEERGSANQFSAGLFLSYSF